MKIYHFFFILLALFAHQAHNSAPNIFECQDDEMLVNNNATSNSKKGLLQAIVTTAFKERRLCAQKHRDSPTMTNELIRYYSQQEGRVLHAIMAFENVESECRLDMTSFNDSFDLRNFLIQVVNARIEDCTATTRWMDKKAEQKQMNTMVANYRNAWKKRFPVVSDALDESHTIDASTTTTGTTTSAESTTTTGTTTTVESTTATPADKEVDIWMIIAIALFCSNCVFAMRFIVLCFRKQKNKSAYPPSVT